MPLTPEQAAEVAARHGLGIADAASLRSLADDEATADRIAARFAGSGDTRAWVRHLFADDEAATPAPAPEPGPANHVPNEGHSAPPATDDEAEQRRFVRELFGYDH
jgi:hypothetical protein